MGRNQLFAWLKANKYLMDNNTPYQVYIDKGYFTVVEAYRITDYGTKFFPKTMITGLGQAVITEKIVNSLAS